MAIEAALYALVTGDAGMTALIGNRLYPAAAAPQTAVRPLGVYQRVSTQRGLTFDGSELLARPRFQFTWIAATHTAVIAVADAARGLLHGYSGGIIHGCWLEGEVESFADESDGFVIRQDFMLWHEED